MASTKRVLEVRHNNWIASINRETKEMSISKIVVENGKKVLEFFGKSKGQWGALDEQGEREACIEMLDYLEGESHA